MTAPNPARLSSAQLEYAFTERARLERREAELEGVWNDEARAVAARLAEIQAALDADERARIEAQHADEKRARQRDLGRAWFASRLLGTPA